MKLLSSHQRRNRFCYRAFGILVSSIAVLLGLQTIEAATETFDGGAAGTGTDLNSPANWSADTKPLTGDEAEFATVTGAGAPLTTTGNNQTFGDLIWNSNTSNSITIDTSGATGNSITLSGGGGSTQAIADGGAAGDLLLMGTTATTNTLTIGGNAGVGTGQLALVVDANGNFDVVNAGATLNLTASISGAFTISKTGAGTLILAGNNSFTNFTQSNGTTQLSGSGTLGLNTGTLTVNGGTLDLNGTSQATGNFTGIGGTVLNNSTGTNVTLTIGNGNGTGGTFAGTIADHTVGTGTVALTKVGTGTITLTGANTYSGGTTLNAGTINFGNNTAFGTGTITSNGGTIKNTAGVTTTNNLVVNSATTLDVSGGNWTLNGNISGSGAINRGTSANLTLFLGGDNSGYTGTFTSPNNGNAVVRFTSATAGSASAIWVFNNATAGRTTLDVDGGGTISFGALRGSGQIQSNNANGTKTISAGALGLTDTFSGVIANNLSVVALTKVGSGTMTLSGANTYTGTTTVSGGTLALGNNLALQNSALDTSGAGAVTVTGFATPTLGGLIGSTDLSAVIAAGYSSVTALTLNPQTGVNAAYSGIIADGAAGMTLTKTGAGTQILNAANTYTGVTTISAGTLSTNSLTDGGTNSGIGASSNAAANLVINGGTLKYTGAATSTDRNYTFGDSGVTLDASGTGALAMSGAASYITANAARTLTLTGTSTAANTYGGILANNGTGALAVTKSGAGTWALSGVNTYTGPTTVSAGTLNVTGAINGGNTANIGQVNIGNAAGTAALKISGGTVNASKTTAPSVLIGSLANANGSLFMSSGSLSATSEIWLGTATNGYGALTINGGTATVGSWLALGRGTGVGILNVGGGSLTVSTNNLTLGSLAGGTGVATLTGGTTSTLVNVYVGENASGVLNVSGTAVLNISGVLGLQLGKQNGTVSSGIVNLNGGTVTTAIVQKGTGSGTFNFGGGTLKARAASSSFMTGLTNAFVQSGGGTIDNGGFAITVGQALLAPANSGVSGISLSANGTGYIDTPLVTITGGTLAPGGVAATAVANIDYTTGQVTGITITNPGNYTSTAGLAVTFTGGGGTAPAINAISSGANVGGGMTFQGSGTTTLTGANTYTGGTTVNAGTVTAGTGGTLGATTSALTVNNLNTSTGTAVILNLATAVDTTVGSLNGAIATPSSGTNTATINNGGSDRIFTVNQTTVGNYGGVIAGAGSFVLGSLSTDTLTLSGSNTYTGATTVSGGDLIVSGSLNGTLNVNVAAGATLASGPAGSIATALGGDVTISGSLAPGDLGAVGTLTLAPGAGGKLSFLSGSRIDFTISGAIADQIAFSTTDDWLAGSGNMTLSLTGLTASDYGNTYTVFRNVSTTGFAVASITGYDSTNYVAGFTQVGSDYQLSFTAIPEPSMSISLLGGAGVLCLLRRRRGTSQA